MSNLKTVIVPAWLNLIQKELGIADTDFADYEKLSGILSTRDLLIYKVIQFKCSEFFDCLQGAGQGARMSADFVSPIPAPTLEERSMVGELDVTTMVFGPNEAHHRPGEVPLVEVELADTELLIIRLRAGDNAPDSVKDCKIPFASKLVQVLHGRLPLNRLAGLACFKDYVNGLGKNHIFY